MGLLPVASLVFSLSQLFYLIWAKDVIPSKRDTGSTLYSAGVQEATDKVGNAFDSIRSFKDNEGKSIAPELLKRWNEMPVWGKRDSELDAQGSSKNKKWSEMSVWGKRDSELDAHGSNKNKKWKEMSVWGKRDSELDAHGSNKNKKWKEMSVWGKRDSELDAQDSNRNKKWSEMSVWGKRDSELDAQGSNRHKRWSEMSVWGKRLSDAYGSNTNKKWSEMAVWGKRGDNGYGEQQVQNIDNPVSDWNGESMKTPLKTYFTRALRQSYDDAITALARLRQAERLKEKRRRYWSETNSHFTAWGKRAADNLDDALRLSNGQESIAPELLKRWNEMAVWGKRPADLDAYASSKNKKWNEMAVWGKRAANKDKKWNEMAVWGKRADDKWSTGDGEGYTGQQTGNNDNSISEWTEDSLKTQLKPYLSRALQQKFLQEGSVKEKKRDWSETNSHFTAWGKRAESADNPSS